MLLVLRLGIQSWVIVYIYIFSFKVMFSERHVLIKLQKCNSATDVYNKSSADQRMVAVCKHGASWLLNYFLEPGWSLTALSVLSLVCSLLIALMSCLLIVIFLIKCHWKSTQTMYISLRLFVNETAGLVAEFNVPKTPQANSATTLFWCHSLTAYSTF